MKRAAGSILLVLGTVLSLALMGGVYALWSATSATGGKGATRAVTLGAGGQPNVTVTGASVAVSWSPTTLPDSTAVSGYEVLAFDAVTSAPRPVGGTCTGVVSSISCTDTVVPTGAWRYAITPRKDAWVGVMGPLSSTVNVDTTPPVTTITFPVSGAAYSNSTWTGGCAAGVGICGAAMDEHSALTSVRVSLRRASTGLYWNGSSFSSTTEVLLTPSGTTSWRLPFGVSSFPAEGGYSARLVATDATGNVGSTTALFLIDRTAPTVEVTAPAASTTYGPVDWGLACLAVGLCGTAADSASSVASVKVSIRQGSGLYWDGTSFVSPTEVQLLADGTTDWTFPFAITSFAASGTYNARAVATDAAGLTRLVTRSFTIDVTRPAPTALALVNGGGSGGLGKITPGSDSVRVTFGETLAVASVCSAWSGNTTNQTISGTVTVTDNDANDMLTVEAPGCALHVGPIELDGSYVTSTSTFNGTITWTAGSRRITISIGALTSGALNAAAQPAGTATYSPDAAITDARGNLVVTTPLSATGQRF